MANDESLLVQFGLPQLKPQQWADLAAFLKPTIEKIRDHLLARSRENAPIRTGALRQSLYVEPVVTNGFIGFECGSGKDYALKMHEEQYQLGPTSQAHEHTQEGGVGNKYFTRVIDYWYDTYADWIEEALIQYLEKEFTRQ